jgi:predicted dehydrogenase
MENKVRVGMVGTSWFADLVHLPILKSHQQAQISAICGRNRARAEEMAAKYEIPQVFTDYEEMVRMGNLDAVIVAVPDDLHYPITMAALDAGLHVLCEKPMAYTLDQAKQMLAKAEAARLKHMVFFTWRWAPYNRLLKKMVAEGYIGHLFDAQFGYTGGYAYENYYQWKWDRAHGLGVLGDLGSHMIHLAQYIVGDIAGVQARLSARVKRPHPEGKVYAQADDSASLTVQFTNGATGAIFCSAVVELGDRGQEQRITLTGSDGTLEMVSTGLSYSVRGLRRGEQEFQTFAIPEEFLQGKQPNAAGMEETMQLFTHQSIGPRLFIDSILQDRPITPGFAEGVKVQAVIEAAFQSDRSGCWVDVQP